MLANISQIIRQSNLECPMESSIADHSLKVRSENQPPEVRPTERLEMVMLNETASPQKRRSSKSIQSEPVAKMTKLIPASFMKMKYRIPKTQTTKDMEKTKPSFSGQVHFCSVFLSVVY